MNYLLHTDGGSRGNPGPSAAAAILYRRMEEEHSWEVISQDSRYLGDKLTNNYAEYQGLLLGMDLALKHGIKDTALLIRADSELMVRQMTGVYRFSNMDLLRLAEFVKIAAETNNIQLTFEHVRRAFNAEADALVNKCLDNQKGK